MYILGLQWIRLPLIRVFGPLASTEPHIIQRLVVENCHVDRSWHSFLLIESVWRGVSGCCTYSFYLVVHIYFRQARISIVGFAHVCMHAVKALILATSVPMRACNRKRENKGCIRQCGYNVHFTTFSVGGTGSWMGTRWMVSERVLLVIHSRGELFYVVWSTFSPKVLLHDSPFPTSWLSRASVFLPPTSRSCCFWYLVLDRFQLIGSMSKRPDSRCTWGPSSITES